MILTSPLLPVPHGFPTRLGGFSAGVYESLNCALNGPDDARLVEQNLGVIAKAAQVPLQNLMTAVQVHGVDVIEVTPGLAWRPQPTADAVFTEAPGYAVGVRTADCLPVLIADVKARRVAAVHAGWRGVIGQLAPKMVQQFVARGSRVQDLRVALGPAIQACCFEVDGDLPERFAQAFGHQVVVKVEGKQKVHLDLSRAVLTSLAALGLAPSQMHALTECTHCDSRFFSHRRDHGVTGRHLSFISHQF